jgi:hypothetical protein
MNNSFITTTTKNTAPHINLNDEQLNPHNNNKKHNTTHKEKRRATHSPQQQQKTQQHTQS